MIKGYLYYIQPTDPKQGYIEVNYERLFTPDKQKAQNQPEASVFAFQTRDVRCMRSRPIQSIEQRMDVWWQGLQYKVWEKRKEARRNLAICPWTAIYVAVSCTPYIHNISVVAVSVRLSISASALGICCAGDQSCSEKVNHEGFDLASSGVSILE